MSGRWLVAAAAGALLILIAARLLPDRTPEPVAGPGVTPTVATLPTPPPDPAAENPVGLPIERFRPGDLKLRQVAGSLPAVPPELAAMMTLPPVEPPPADEVALGRDLFFDPLLSGSRTIGCASCHQPELGYGDGRERAVGVSGIPTRRNAPTLYNLALREDFTWDGRAPTLEAQMVEGPIIHPDEMAANPATVLADLAAVPAYLDRFEEIYGGLSLQNVARAIAAFERSLLSLDSPFDRYAAGDFYALSGSQRRGFEIFRSESTNCIACHDLPLLGGDEFKVIGVPDTSPDFDGGRGEITGRSEELGAFRVPSLRNVALTAPYFHNGSEPALSGVIAFYLNGGGGNVNVPNSRLDRDLRSFNLNDRSLRDLEAFLLALTDESGRVDPPESLPSGLPPVGSGADAAIRDQITRVAIRPPGPAVTHHVEPGMSVQEAIDRSRPGDTVVLAPGRYFEPLLIDVADLTLQAEGATLVGRPFTPTAIVVRADGLRLQGLTIEGFERSTIDLVGPRQVALVDVTLNGHRVRGEVAAILR